ncbi:MAG: hypothetical protein ACP5M4_00165 [Acidobacteriaceae bacterium]
MSNAEGPALSNADSEKLPVINPEIAILKVGNRKRAAKAAAPFHF